MILGSANDKTMGTAMVLCRHWWNNSANHTFCITSIPDNRITGRGGPISPMALAIEVLQSAFIGLTAAIVIYENKSKKQISGKAAI